MYKSIIGLLFILVLFSHTSFADSGDQYLLPKIGIMSVELNEADSLTSIGLLYGYGISAKFTLEAELNASITGGKYDRTLNTGSRLKGEYTVWTIAGYGVYRLPITNRFFFKGKLGLLYENIERDGIQVTSGGLEQSDDKTSTGLGFAAGLGFGFNLDPIIIENEMTVIDDEIIFYSVGINYTFR